MAQCCDGYSDVSLMGNWYEERIADKQEIRKNPESRYMREEEESISYMSHDNQMRPLPRTQRCPPWKTKCIIPDDGYREFRSLQQTNYDITNIQNYYKLGDCRNIINKKKINVKFVENNPYTIQTHGAKKYKMLNVNNFVKQMKIHRPVDKRRTDFGSTLRRHDETHERFYGMTSYQRDMSRPLKQTAKNVISNCKVKNKQFAGINFREPENSGPKLLSACIGEYYKKEREPKDNTLCQRNWIPNIDKGVKVANFNLDYNKKKNKVKGVVGDDLFMANYRQNTSQKIQYDNANSIPIGQGAYKRQEKHMGAGQFRHLRTDVTMIKNRTFATR